MSICLSRFAIQESKKIPIIVHPLKTSSCGMFSRIKFEKTWSTKYGNRRQAFSVVGVKNMACPAIPKRRRKSSVSATFCLSPLPEIGEGFGEWSEAPSYEEGVGGDGEQQGFALQNAPFFVSFLSVMKEMKAPCRVKPCIKKYLLDVFFGGLEKKPYLCRLNVLVC